MEHFWNLEPVGVLPIEGKAENKLEHYLTSSVTRDDDGAYITRFPWKPNHPTLPTNFTVTEHRTRQLAKRLAKTPELLQVYNQIIAEQEARGFIERVELTSNNSRVHYIPHHAVEKDSPTTPIRIVFDYSCQPSPSYPSLNDCDCPVLMTFMLFLSALDLTALGSLQTLRRGSCIFACIQMTGTLLASSG